MNKQAERSHYNTKVYLIMEAMSNYWGWEELLTGESGPCGAVEFTNNLLDFLKLLFNRDYEE